ncbi:recombinase family protein [Kitasatospora sp. NPDC096077]|uniref:recombinase family protein n=1 Tax=Kitasatospora sp. NPDC096077 TaxID=3155544 RepID=UPI00332B75E8
MKRISRDTETSSALERQHADLSRAIVTGGHTLVEWVEDATVSGAVNLWDRKSLGKWLKEPLIHTWDALMVTEQDRISRNDLHWSTFVGWVLEHEKSVIILDDPGFDLSTSRGRMMANVKAGLASDYREAVSKKRLNQTEHFRAMGFWPGGVWPFGYRAVRVETPEGFRWKLVPDPVTSKLILEAYDRIVNQGWTVSAVVRDWNQRKIMSASDHQRHCNAVEGREGVKTELRNNLWNQQNLKAALRNPVLLGHAVHEGKTIMGPDGMPSLWADPVLTESQFEALQKALDKRSRKVTTKRTSAPLHGVVFCECENPFNRNPGKKRNGKAPLYYRCRKCDRKTNFPAEYVERVVYVLVMDKVGHLEIMDRTYIPGVDHAEQIKTLRDGIERLTWAIAAATSKAQVEAITATMGQHSETLAKLEAEPVIPGRWEEAGTGQTFIEWFAANLDPTARGDFLRNLGVRIMISKVTEPVVGPLDFLESDPNELGVIVRAEWPEDLAARISGTVASSRQTAATDHRAQARH